MNRVYGFNPIYDSHSKVLIIGSIPSVISRKNNFYYANPNNRFWKIIEQLFQVSLDSNQDKRQFLLNNHIAMWDVIHSCNILGSSDAHITNVKVNDINKILTDANIQVIFCTGKKAYNLFQKYFKVNIEVFYLPSPSGANAVKSLNDLITDYQIIKQYL